MAFDFLFKEIKVGDTVVYPGRKRSDLWMNKGVVTALYDFGNVVEVETSNKRLVRIARTDRLVVV